VGNPLELVAPAEEGTYEVRYASGLSGQALAQATLTVKKPEATLEAPERVTAGERVEVVWTGPNLGDDIVALAPAGAGAEEYTAFAETAAGSPATLRAPSSPGGYEVRYVDSEQHRVVARRPVEVVLPEVSLKVPAAVPPRARFKVFWSGPNGPDDFVTLVPKGVPESQFKEWAYTTAGSP
jgi:Ca-activated chloride channel family protein